MDNDEAFIDLARSIFRHRLLASVISGGTPLSVARDVEPLLNDLEIP